MMFTLVMLDFDSHVIQFELHDTNDFKLQLHNISFQKERTSVALENFRFSNLYMDESLRRDFYHSIRVKCNILLLGKKTPVLFLCDTRFVQKQRVTECCMLIARTIERLPCFFSLLGGVT